MSLLNANDGNCGTVIVKKVVRNSKTESFADTVIYGMGESIDFWSKALNFIYRRRTFAKIRKRDRICGGPSAYIECLAEVSMGNNVNPVIAEMLANPPQPNGGLIRGSKYCNKIMLECRKDMTEYWMEKAKVGLQELAAWVKAKRAKA